MRSHRATHAVILIAVLAGPLLPLLAVRGGEPSAAYRASLQRTFRAEKAAPSSTGVSAGRRRDRPVPHASHTHHPPYARDA